MSIKVIDFSLLIDLKDEVLAALSDGSYSLLRKVLNNPPWPPEEKEELMTALSLDPADPVHNRVGSLIAHAILRCTARTRAGINFDTLKSTGFLISDNKLDEFAADVAIIKEKMNAVMNLL